MSHVWAHRDGKVKDILSVLTTSHPKGLLLRERSGQEYKGRTGTSCCLWWAHAGFFKAWPNYRPRAISSVLKIRKADGFSDDIQYCGRHKCHGQPFCACSDCLTPSPGTQLMAVLLSASYCSPGGGGEIGEIIHQRERQIHFDFTEPKASPWAGSSLK